MCCFEGEWGGGLGSWAIRMGVAGLMVGPSGGRDGVGGRVCKRFSRRLKEYVCRKVCMNRSSPVPGGGKVHASMMRTLGRVEVPMLH